ncbi:hypothetical protein HGRIS_006318 [Hohenbuehelia grisea]|uniref:ABM domain-containing protein n=1 Tax=Hohenbuehelia grisea TaxID=104357 RepID=A0ABR3JZT5_9AGAR
MPTTEIVTFRASEAFKKDLNLLKPVGDAVKKEEGFIQSWFGFQVEDPNIAYIFILWESYEHHKAVIDSPSYGIEIVEPLKLCVDGPLNSDAFDMTHVPFAPDVVTALSAPTTEIAYIKHKDGTTETLHGLLEKLAEKLDKAEGARPPCAYGPSREKEGTSVLVVGWTSAEAHYEGVAADKPPFPIIQTIQESSQVSFKHIKLSKS